MSSKLAELDKKVIMDVDGCSACKGVGFAPVKGKGRYKKGIGAYEVCGKCKGGRKVVVRRI